MTQADRGRLVTLRQAQKKLIKQRGLSARQGQRGSPRRSGRSRSSISHGGLCRIWRHVGRPVPGEPTSDRGQPGDGAQVDYVRGGAGLESWCSGTPAITTGWKGAGNGYI